MTNNVAATAEEEEMDELDRLTNPEKVKVAMVEDQRSDFRPKWKHIIADIADEPVQPYEAELQNGNKVRRVAFHLQNVKVLETYKGEVIDDDDFYWEIPLPKKASDTSEVALTTQSAIIVDKSITSIRGLAGKKQVELLEKVHQFQGRRPTGEKKLDEKTLQEVDVWGSATISTYYYAVISIGGKGVTSGPPAKAKATAPSPEAVAAALALLDGDGMTEKEFGKAASKDKVAGNDGILMDLIGSGDWVKEMVRSGKIELAEDTGVLTLGSEV